MPNNLVNIVIINNREGLTWGYTYKALRNIKTINNEMNQVVNSNCRSISVTAVNKTKVQHKKSKIKCSICNQTGHVVAQCRIIH